MCILIPWNYARLACLQWRLEHMQNHDCRILHLTDSLVCLHSMTRGRTSSRRLRRTLRRINSQLLAHNVVGLWGTPKVICEGTTQARRARDRQKLGTLRQLTVQPSTTITGVALIDLGPTLINKLREVLSSSSEFIKHLSNKKVSHKFSTVYKLHVSR